MAKSAGLIRKPLIRVCFRFDSFNVILSFVGFRPIEWSVLCCIYRLVGREFSKGADMRQVLNGTADGLTSAERWEAARLFGLSFALDRIDKA
jgi:hypothetical protein